MPIYGQQPHQVSLPRRTRRKLPAGLRPNQQQPQTAPSIGQSVLNWAGGTDSQPALAPGRQARPAVSPFNPLRPPSLGSPLLVGETPAQRAARDRGQVQARVNASLAEALGGLQDVVPRPYESPMPAGLDQNGNPVQVQQKTTGPGILRNPVHDHIGQGGDAFRNLGKNISPFIGLGNLNSPGSPALEMATTEAMLKNLPTGRFSPQVEAYVKSHPHQGTSDRLNEMWQDAYDEALEARLNQNGANAIQGRTRRILSQLDQPQQRLDGAAALQGRLTATGRRYPTYVDQGPQQPAFQPQAGTLSGGSTVEVTPEGRAIVRGNLDERRMNALGIRQVPIYEQVGDYGQRQIGTRRDDSRMILRQAFNRQRQENELLARRLGQAEEYTPGAPAPLTADMEQLQAGLGALRGDRNKLSDLLRRRILERQGRPNIPSFLMEEDSAQVAQNHGADQGVMWRNQYNQDYTSLLAARPNMDPEEADRIARDRADRMHPEGAPGEGDVPSGSSSQPRVRNYPMTAQGASSAETDLQRKYPQFYDELKPLSEEEAEDWLEREFPDGAPLDLETQILAWKRGGQTQRQRQASRDRHQWEEDNQERSFNQLGLPGLSAPPRSPDGTGRIDIRFRGA